jgi:hypothetical protein
MDNKVFIIRGHIRSGFDNDKLYLFTKKLVKLYNVDVYIHTWNVFQSSLSWRKLQDISTPVTEDTITNYFKDIPIKKIIIDDDSKIEIFGRTVGKLCATALPILAWKNMWYGIHEIMSVIPNDSFIINTRFDYFNLVKSVIVGESNLLNSIKIVNNEISFAINKSIPGVDNFYSGPFEKLYLLTKDFHNNLDEIENRFKSINAQEKMVYLYAKNIYTDTDTDTDINFRSTSLKNITFINSNKFVETTKQRDKITFKLPTVQNFKLKA